MTFSYTIKDLSTVRGFVRQFCAHGFKSHDDYGKRSSSYEDVRKRLDAWLNFGKDEGVFRSFVNKNGKKCYFMCKDGRDYFHNPLNAVYKNRSFSENDIFLHYTILDYLKMPGGHKRADINGYVSDVLENRFGVNLNLDYQDNIRIKLGEYIGLGLIREDKAGKAFDYYYNNNQIDKESWKDALSFYSEAGILSIVGTYLTDKYHIKSSYFSFKHHYMHHVLDSEVLNKLLQAISEHRLARINVILQGNLNGLIKTDACENVRREEVDVQPFQIRVSVRSGRRWVLTLMDGKYRPFRLDYIDSVTLGDVAEPVDEKMVEWLNTYLWGVTSWELYKTERVEMVIQAQANERYVLARMEREKRNAEVQWLDDNTLRLTADVCDAQEMLPWLLSFAGFVQSMTCSNPEVEKIFWDSIRDMKKLYSSRTEGSHAEA